jgi:ferredoxin
MAIKVNQKTCIGCGACVQTCPEVFEMADSGKAKVKAQKDLPCVKAAIDGCPVTAISE